MILHWCKPTARPSILPRGRPGEGRPEGPSMSKSHSTLLAAAGLLLALTTLVAAQDYPDKPVRLIIPFPPGGSNDVVGRMIGTQLSERLGKQVVVDNRAGAGGVVGTELAASAPKDGYTHPDHIDGACGQSLALQAALRSDQGVHPDLGARQRSQRGRRQSRACRSTRSRIWSRSPSRSRASCNMPRPASAASSISAASCSSSRPASTCCTCRSRAAARR